MRITLATVFFILWLCLLSAHAVDARPAFVLGLGICGGRNSLLRPGAGHEVGSDCSGAFGVGDLLVTFEPEGA